MGLVFFISNFYITKTSLANKWMRKEIPSCSNSALVASQILHAAFLRHCVGTYFLHSVVCSVPPCHFSHKSLSLEASEVPFFPFYFFGVVGVVCMVFRVVRRFENLEGQGVIKCHLIEYTVV